MALVEREFTAEQLITVEDFWAYIARPENADRKLELVNGVIVEDMSPSYEHGRYGSRIYSPILMFLQAHDLGEVVFEVDHYVPPDRFNTRRPDIEFNTWETLKGIDPAHPVPRMPDMAIEIRSPGNTKAELRQKAAFYLQHGTRLVWVVYIDERMVVVYTPQQPSGLICGMDAVLDGGDLLPGFRLAVKDIFR
jgi:Uma2 family endonuclease